MSTVERRRLLEELIKLADGERTSAESKTLLDLLHERLQCPDSHHGGLPGVLNTALNDIIVDKRSQALAGFQRNRGRLDPRTSDGAAAYIAAFGELLGLTDAEILNDLAVARREVETLKGIRDNDRTEDYKRRQLAGMWIPRRVVDERSVRRVYKELLQKSGEVILTASMLNALIAYLDVAEHIRTCRKQLDEAVRRRNEAAAEDVTTWPVPDYVRRAKIEQRFSDLVDAGLTKPIAFVGQAGMGKTVAAKALTDKYSSRPPAPLIRFIDGQISEIDLQVALQRQGVAAPHITSENAQENLVRLISAENAPEFVILDNFENLDQVAALLPYHTESCIVATCRAMGKVVPSKFDVISVSKMTNDEASAMAMRLIPDLSSADASDIAEVLDCYPLAICHACTLITGTHVRAKDLCCELRRKPHGIMEENKEKATLHKILSRVVTVLREEGAIAFELLILSLTSNCTEFVLRFYVEAKLSHVDIELTYAQALSTLQQYSLITIEPGDFSSKMGPSISIHSLTRTILWDLVCDYATVVHDTVASAVILHLANNRMMDRDALQSERVNFLFGFLVLLIAWNHIRLIDARASGDKEISKRHHGRIVKAIEDWEKESSMGSPRGLMPIFNSLVAGFLYVQQLYSR